MTAVPRSQWLLQGGDTWAGFVGKSIVDFRRRKQDFEVGACQTASTQAEVDVHFVDDHSRQGNH